MNSIQVFNGIDVLDLAESLSESPLGHYHQHHRSELDLSVPFELVRVALQLLENTMNGNAILQGTDNILFRDSSQPRIKIGQKLQLSNFVLPCELPHLLLELEVVRPLTFAEVLSAEVPETVVLKNMVIVKCEIFGSRR